MTSNDQKQWERKQKPQFDDKQWVLVGSPCTHTIASRQHPTRHPVFNAKRQIPDGICKAGVVHVHQRTIPIAFSDTSVELSGPRRSQGCNSNVDLTACQHAEEIHVPHWVALDESRWSQKTQAVAMVCHGGNDLCAGIYALINIHDRLHIPIVIGLCLSYGCILVAIGRNVPFYDFVCNGNVTVPSRYHYIKLPQNLTKTRVLPKDRTCQTPSLGHPSSSCGKTRRTSIP